MNRNVTVYIKTESASMTMVAGAPFLEWQIRQLKKNGFTNIVLVSGDDKEKVMEYFSNGEKFGVSLDYCPEDHSGGDSLLRAMRLFPSENVIVLTGGVFFDIDLKWFYSYFLKENRPGSIFISLKYKEAMQNYASVEIDKNYSVTSYLENSSGMNDGYVDGGTYIGKGKIFQEEENKNSPLKDVFPNLLKKAGLIGVPFGDKFIDMRVPEDFCQADENLKDWFHQTKNKALFLDRDGVIIEDTGYLSDEKDIIYIPEIFEVIKTANRKGYKVVVLTNQSGVARGYFGEEEVDKINKNILKYTESKGGRIDKVYVCPFHPDGEVEKYRKKSLLRKPEAGMVLKAADELFIDIHESVMVGDKDSDIIRLPYLKSFLVQGNYDLKKKESLIDYHQLKQLLI